MSAALPDIEGLPRVGGTAAGGYYEVAPDVLLAYPHDGYIQTEEGARASMLEMYRIARERGRRVVTVVLVDRVKNQDSAARRVWKDEVDTNILCGLALVSSSMLGRAIASFFIGLTKPRVPTRMMATYPEALDWAEQRLRDGGGPFDE